MGVAPGALPPGLHAADLEPSTRPFGHSWTLPPVVYRSADILTWERTHLFDAGWVCAGRGAEVSRPGERLAVRLSGGASVLLVRNSDGALHVLANVCRHRGHEVAACGAGATAGGSTLVCPYHGWVYELDGRLRGGAWIDETPALGKERDQLGLLAVRHVEWGGFVFVNVDGMAPPFTDVLGSLAGFEQSHELADLVSVQRTSYELAANWKLAIENYHECWHCPVIHPALEQRTASTSGELLPGAAHGAWVGGTMRFSDGFDTMTRSGWRLGRVLRGADPARVAYIGLFPNLLLALHPDYVLTHRVDPIDARRSTVTCEWLVPADTAAAGGFDVADAVDFWDEVNRQDWAAVESVQRGIDSPLYRRGPLGIVEDDVYGFVQMLAAAYLGDRPEGVRQQRKVR